MKAGKLSIFALATVLGLGLGLLIVISIPKPYTFQGSYFEQALPAADFTLQDQHGRPFTLSQQRGKVVLIFFGYTSCPDVCPTTLGEYKKIAQRLGERADQVAFVMITADPERDTPERLGNYVSTFHPDFLGLTGSPEALQAVYDAYGVFVEKEESESKANYLVSHTSRVYVIDPDGNLRLTFPFGMAAESMAEDVLHLLPTGMKGNG